MAIKRAVLSAPKVVHDRTLKCPDCGRSLRLSPVNTNAGNRVKGGYKSMRFCVMACGYEKYVKESIEEVMETLRTPIKRPSKRQRRSERANIKWGEIKPCCK